MASPKSITHSRWLRGLQAGFDRYSQPKGSVARVSNLLMTKRGAWKVCDGTQLITTLDGHLEPYTFGLGEVGPITEIFLFQPTGASAGYFGIIKDRASTIPAPTGLAAVAGAAGLLTGVYHYVITALDGVGGETGNSAEVTVTLTAQQGNLSWTPVANASGGYNIYRTLAGGASFSELFVATVPGQSSAAYVDNIPDASIGPKSFPSSNTTQVCQFYSFTTPAYNYPAQIVKTFPADNLIFNPSVPGGGGGGNPPSPGGGGYAPPTASGGISGNLSPLPIIVQFVNKMMLALGNGIGPYQSDGTSGGTTALTNTFSAAYPTWVASTVFNQGDQIQVLIGGVKYVFTATQGGVTGAGGAPAFSATLGSTVPDNNIIWKNSGQVTGSPAPRGAAHAEVYAGSLWVANTSPIETSDQLDGPSALRMSDLNNPLSWNPLNAAQISPDDGDQGTGIKAFTVAEAGIAPQNFLMYFKNYATYLIQGVFGAADFAITRLQTDLGCIAPRSLQFVPGYGIMRLTHLGFAVTDGISDKLQDPEAIRPYLFADSDDSDIAAIDWSYIYFAKAAQTANPPMYVCACPVLQFATGTYPAIPIATSAGTLPNVTYYIVIQKLLPNGQILQTPEITVGPTTGFTITFPNDTPHNYQWRVFIGTASGAENQFVSVTAGSVTLVISSFSGFQSGTIGSSLGNLTRIFCYDLILKAWTVVDLPFPISVLHQFRTPGSFPITVMGGFNDLGIRRWQAGDTAWDAGATNANASSTAIQWSLKDAELYVEGGSGFIFHNQVIIRGDGSPSAINVTPEISGTLQQTISAALIALGGGQYDARVRIMQRAENMNLTISGSGPATIESVVDLAQPRPAGADLVFG